jgi:hypothetical protein
MALIRGRLHSESSLLEPGMTLMLRNEAAFVLLMNWGRIPDAY